VTVIGRVADPFDGTDRMPEAGVMPHANEPTQVAPQTSDAPGPFARTVNESA